MKTLLLPLLAHLFSGMLLAEEAREANPVHFDFSNAGRASVGLDVKETAASKAIGHNWETDYGSYDRDFARSRTLSITASNVGHSALSGTHIEVLWFAQKLKDKSLFIFSRQTKASDVPAGRGRAVEFSMPILNSNVTNYATLRERYVAGSKFAGYVAVIRNGEKVLSLKASTPTLEQFTRTSERFDELLKAAGPGKGSAE
jgi:hypothetical protein